MPRQRKTVTVKEVVELCNAMIAWPGRTQEEKRALRTVAENILYRTHNYHGFQYIKWAGPEGYDKWVEDGKPEDKTPYLGDPDDMFYIV